ncbi:MAG: Maf family protein, partial [Lachnospiraceae bacterium]|nr:Maf family protein [Lachnospiraceae bacterium]
MFEAHKDQRDKSGLPYVFHPFHLAEQMTDEEINWYIDHEENVYTSAGYSIETKASLFISRIEGDYK